MDILLLKQAVLLVIKLLSLELPIAMLVAIPHHQAIQLLVLVVLQDSFGIQGEIHVIQPAKLMIL